jgi:hypothetical protein
MTTQALRFTPLLHSVIAKTKQRARRRRLRITVVLVVALAAAAIGLVAARSPSGANAKVEGLSLPAGTRSCGILGVGIGWQVWGSSTLSCRSGRAFFQAFLRASHWPAPATFRGYACTSRALPSGVGSFSCARGGTALIAISNH